MVAYVLRRIMRGKSVHTTLLICFWILSTYLHSIAELDAIEEYNTSLIEDNDSSSLSFYRTKTANRQEIDIVYTWVNGSERKFQHDFDSYIAVIHKPRADVLALNRFLDYGSLKYSLRSVEKYANWIGHIYLVTNGQIPDWLNLDNPRVSVVTHEELFSNKSHLPTFASPAIECHIHKIKGLSEHFLYMNDDLILTSKLQISNFLSESGEYKLRFMRGKLERCNKLCGSNNVNNGICESNCSTRSCEWDGDDCRGLEVDPNMEDDINVAFDSWMGSMMHTHFLFNKAFGIVNRYIPEHGPHLFNRNIIRQISMKFPFDWERTSSQKIRHSLSIQYQFAYNNFLLSLEKTGITNIKTNITWVKECCDKDTLEFDNRSVEARRKQIKEAKNRILLFQPHYIIVTTRFMNMLSPAQLNEFTKDVTDFLQDLLPTPSMFETR